MAAPTELTRFTLPVENGQFKSSLYGAAPIFADLDGDGREELINPTAGSKLMAFKLDANNQPVPYMRYETGGSENIKSTPVVITLPNGRKAIFAALGRDEGASPTTEDGRVFGWDAQTGRLLDGWPQSMDLNVVRQSGVYGPLATGDLDGDGVPEIVATSFSHKVIAFKLNGQRLWTWDNDDTILSGVAIGDLDRDGKPEVVLGGDSSNNGFYKPGGFVNILSNTGVLKYRTELPGETIWATPTLADVNGDGYLEIFVGTGINYARNGGATADELTAGNRIHGLDFRGQNIAGFPYTTGSNTTQHQVISPVAVADMNGDGKPEVVAIDRLGYLHVVQTTVPNAGQPLPAFVGGRLIASPYVYPTSDADSASPIIADIDGNGTPDIVASSGPFVVGIDVNGNEIFRGSAQLAGQGLPEFRFGAPAIGNFDGRGGLDLVAVSELGGRSTRPSSVIVYSLDPSTLTPAWPLQRKTAEGRAVLYSSAFVNSFITSTFNGFLGRLPSANELASMGALILNNTLSPSQVASIIAGTQEARGRVVDGLYQKFLGRVADPGGRAGWINALATRTVRDISVGFITSPEFSRIGGTPRGVVKLMYRYLLLREASEGELNSWDARMKSGTTITDIARIFLAAPEYITAQSNAFARAAFGNAFNFNNESKAALSFDFHANEREETMYARILVTGGNYAQANPLAGRIRTIYRDLLNREASGDEVANVLKTYDGRPFDSGGFIANLLNSPEARRNFVTESFRKLLGRLPSAAELSANQNYASRATLLQTILSGDEYFRAKGNVTNYVIAVYSDLGGVGLPASDAGVSSFIKAINGGQPRSIVPAALLKSDLYFNKLALDFVFQYLPNEDMGVLRTANIPRDQTQVAINPDPRLLAEVSAFIKARTPEQGLALLLGKDRYIAGTSYFKGFYNRQMVRTSKPRVL